MTNRFPFLLSLSIGYISLSQEILWIRVFGFANHSIPQAFAAVLALFLLGIALGALVGKSICSRFLALYPISGAILVASGLFDILAPTLYGYAAGSILGLPVLAAVIFLTALNKSILFPIAHHLGSINTVGSVGGIVSRVYFFNVIGATLGPIITGFVLLDHFSVHACMILMGLMTIVVGILCLLKERAGSKLMTAFCVVMVPAIVVTVKSLPPHLSGLSTQIALATSCRAVKQVVENKHGIIHVCPTDLGDMVYGGNVYDGMIKTDPITDSNRIKRLIILTALQSRPKKVLMIGLSGGAWLSILTRMPEVDEIDVVEINPGYLKVIAKYAEMSRALEDPRVRLHIDDGRRWLINHPEDTYDLVVMNTTWYWRINITNLLSVEFLSEVKSHMNKGAVLAYNSTYSPDVFYTASVVFPHAYRYGSFVYASENDFRTRLKSPEGREKVGELITSLSAMASPGQIAEVTNALVGTEFATIERITADMQRSPELITDQNMITEYKYGRILEYVRRYDSIWSFLTCMTCKRKSGKGWDRHLY